MKRQYSKPTAEKLEFDYMETVVASEIKQEDTGKGDVGRGRGQGGGCDGDPYHTNQRTFNNGLGC